MQVLSPTSVDEALTMMSGRDGPVTPIAGGTDLLVAWHHQPKDDLTLLNLWHLAELHEFRFTDDHLELGALTTYWQTIESNRIAEEFPLLTEAALQVGAIQIQTRGTWAGNIGNGSPAADGVPVMMAYDAVVVLRSSSGTVEVPLDRYYTGYKQTVRKPDQLITAIRIPRRRRDVEWFHKVGSRSAQTISKVGAAVVKDDRGWRVAVNSVAPFVCRCRKLEQALDAGRSFQDPESIRRIVAQDISPITDMRSTAAYRETVLARLLFHFLSE
ncbi:MAG: FAD binding domain-containing protein [Phycisphaerae bacterium]